MINEALADKQGLSEQERNEINTLHSKRSNIIKQISNTKISNKKTIQRLLKRWSEIEFELQEAWKFEKDANFHRFWELPHCKCPKMDNDDNYPHGYYVIVENCPLHGEIVSIEKNKIKTIEKDSLLRSVSRKLAIKIETVAVRVNQLGKHIEKVAFYIDRFGR